MKLHDDLMQIRPWPDAVIDKVGHDARSRYVEQFWLGILGPSTTWFLRLIAHRLDTEPAGFVLDLPATARTLGLGERGPLQRTIERAVRFDLARQAGVDGLDVRRRLPPLNRGQVARLHEAAQQAHADWQEHLLSRNRFEDQQRRARLLALSLFETGEEPVAVERELHRWRYHPALAADATRWALDRHRLAATAVLEAT
jgi:hypothetical protein